MCDDGKTLYFSSNGHNSIGGYDIFKSELDSSGNWSTPVNLGYPINTTGDDMYAIVFGSGDSLRGFFSADRGDSYGGKDLYMFYNVNYLKKQGIDTNKILPVDSNLSAKKDSSINKPDTTEKIKVAEIVKKDTLSNIKTADTLQTTKIESKTPKELLPDSTRGVIFYVQVGASHRKMMYDELHKRYPGTMPVTEIWHEGWHKYLIGKFRKYSESRELKFNCGTWDAWVVTTRDGVRINIREVLSLLSYYPSIQDLIDPVPVMNEMEILSMQQ